MDCGPCSQAKAMWEEISRLEKALAFIDEDLEHELSLALITLLYSKNPTVGEVEDLLGTQAYEVVLLGFTWRLILPHAAGDGSMAWEDASLPLERSGGLKLPQIGKILTQQAAKSGFWITTRALMQSSPLLPRDAKTVANLGNNIVQYSPGGVISANEIKAALAEAGIDCSLDALIVQWKSAGAISPRLSCLKSVTNHRSPVYEVHPALYVPGFKDKTESSVFLGE